MQDLILESGRLKINMKAIAVGEDLCVIISGGDRPHIGCVTLSLPRSSLVDENENSATTSVLNLLGHKDDEAARHVSHILSASLKKNVVVTCGIHIDKITNEDISTVMELLQKGAKILIQKYELRNSRK